MLPSNLPPVCFAPSGDINLAYHLWGDGPADIVFVPGIVYHLEAVHELPGVTEFFQRLARFSRTLVFDKRGQGLSDRVSVAATMDERADDIRAVMNSADMPRCVLIGYSEGAALAAYYAAFHPDQVSHLVLVGGFPKFSRSEDYPFGLTDEQIRRSAAYYSQGHLLRAAMPAWADDEILTSSAGRFERLSCSPGNYRSLIEMNLRLDARHILPQIRMPTLVLHNTGDLLAPVEGGRYFADHIPGARLIEYPDNNHWITCGDYDAIAADIEEFVTGTRPAADISEEDRILATVLFTDIVGSTSRAAEMGDAAWQRVLDEHDRVLRRLVEQHRGRVVKTTGDGMLALFEGPSRAIRCALALEPSLARLQLQIRAGLHTGEVIERGEDVAGIAVHAAARIMAEAGPGEVLVSRVVTDLVAGVSMRFTDRGEVTLRGIEGDWRLFAVSM